MFVGRSELDVDGCSRDLEDHAIAQSLIGSQARQDRVSQDPATTS